MSPKTGKCKRNDKNPFFFAKMEIFAVLDKQSLILALNKGPVIVSMHASNEFYQYKEGFYYPENCSGRLN